MTRVPWIGVALALCVWVSAGARQDPVFRAGVDTVSVFATVVDGERRLVTGLTADDFEIYDNGVRQLLTGFSNAPQPFSLVMMIDRSGSMAAHFDRVRGAAEVFIDRLMLDDRVRIGSFSNRIQIDPAAFTNDRSELRRVLRDELQEMGESPVWNATSAAINALSSQANRRVVFLFSDGHDSTSLGQPVSFREVRGRVAAEDVLVYAIGFSEPCAAPSPVVGPRFQTPRPPIGGGRPPGGGAGPGRGGPGRGTPIPRFPPQGPSIPIPIPIQRPRRGFGDTRTGGCRVVKPDASLRELTEASGGGYFEWEFGADLEQTFGRVADELHQQYLLAFTPLALDNKEHELTVRVRGRGRTVRSRTTYIASER